MTGSRFGRFALGEGPYYPLNSGFVGTQLRPRRVRGEKNILNGA